MSETDNILEKYRLLPNVWGEGAIFAFSGLDGETCSASGFVLTTHRSVNEFLIHTPVRYVLDLCCDGFLACEVLTGDVFIARYSRGNLTAVFASWHTLVGVLPPGGHVHICNENGDQISLSSGICSDDGATVALKTSGRQFALAYGSSEQESLDRAGEGLHLNILNLVEDRLVIYNKLPACSDHSRELLYRKCFSVMKVNALSAEGGIQQSWSTPDRVPHRDMWLWDSVFHSLAMNLVDSDFGWEYLKSVLDSQDMNGMISHQVRVNGWKSSITQPPILAWGVWENYQRTHDKERLAYAVPRLSAYLQWDMDHRDNNQNGLLEWYIEENELCRSGESGMDNSQRFDAALVLDAVDFSVFAALDMRYLSLLFSEVNEPILAQDWMQKSRSISSAIHDQLWNPQDGFYFDRTMEGDFSPVKAVTGFLPLLLEDIPTERVTKLVDTLRDPAQYWTEFPIPSVSVDTPNWCTDMWRGASWINMNYLIWHGLLSHGHTDPAHEIRERCLNLVNHYYHLYGVVFEFYDAKNEVPPILCDRKGKQHPPYDIRRKMDSIRDYHWTAALCFLWLLAD